MAQAYKFTDQAMVAGSNHWQLTLYSYDSEGRVAEQWIYTGDRSDWETYLSYDYNRQGEVTRRQLTAGGETLYHHYSYNQRGLLDSVFVSTDGQQPPTAEVTYTYTASGGVDEITYKGGREADYGYTIRDWVQRINDAGSTSGNFAADYNYADNGNISSATYFNPDIAMDPAHNTYTYDYSYDALSRLTGADYQLAGSNPDAFDVAGLSYDDAGNIQSLQRRDESGALIDDLDYSSYQGNRLMQLDDAADGGGGGAATTAIYEDGLVSPWIDVSWDATVDYASSEQAYQGSTSIKVEQQAWGSLSLRSGDWGSAVDVPLADYEAVEFEVYAPDDPVELDFQVSNTDGDSFQRVIWGTAPAGQWTTVSIPVSDFNPGGHEGHRFIIGEISGANSITYYVDNLRLKGSGGGTGGGAALTAVYDDSLLSPWIDASWDVTLDFASSEQAYQGSTSIKVEQQAWGTLSLRSGGWGNAVDVPLANYEAFEFEVYAPDDSVELDFNVSNTDGDSFQRVIWGTAPAGQWTTVSIPVSDFNPGGHEGHRFNIGEISGANSITYYVDNIRLKAGGDGGGDPSQLAWDAESGSFDYDANGNLTAQSGKFSGIEYDHRNLPTRFDMEGGGSLMAAYNTDGQRILKESSGGAWQFYVRDGARTLAVIDQNGLSHMNLLGNETFGRWEPGGTRRYYVKDHLGSTRAVVDEGGNLLETFDYYPFGLLMPQRTTAGANTIDKFTGKERDTEAGVNLDYFGARYYDGAIGRWNSVDPLADEYSAWSPYNYTLNDPINLVDPDGNCPMPNGDPFCIGVRQGFQDAVTSTLEGIGNLFSDPVGTIEGISNALANPVQTFDAIKEGVGERVDMATSGNPFQRGQVAGEGIALVGEALVGTKGAGSVAKGANLLKTADKVNNPVPKNLARVVDGDASNLTTLGRPGASDVFVTGVSDIRGLNAAGLSNKLTIPQSGSFTIIEFPTSSKKGGIASPIRRSNPGFVGRGLTKGGAREFVVPNQPIPANAKIKKVQQ